MINNLDSKYERDYTEPTYPKKFQATRLFTRTDKAHRDLLTLDDDLDRL
jgi:hypothetical protein